jgi:hypothetical protein
MDLKRRIEEFKEMEYEFNKDFYATTERTISATSKNANNLFIFSLLHFLQEKRRRQKSARRFYIFTCF